MSTADAAGLPSLADALGWVGAEVAELEGGAVGQAEALYVDRESGEPRWLIARLGRRRRRARIVAIPLADCAGAPFGVWVAQGEEAIRTAPVVDPTRPLRREHELAICDHFEIGEAVGRAAEVAGRGDGEVTATPPNR